MARDFTVLTDVALITCIVQKGAADPIIKAARDAGASGATVNYARGTGVRERLGLLGVAAEVEKEIVNIVVPTDIVDHVFETMYMAGGLDTPGMGFIYVTPLDKAATFIPQEVIDKIQSQRKPASANGGNLNA